MKSQENSSSTYGLRRRVYEFFVGVFFRNRAKKNLVEELIQRVMEARDGDEVSKVEGVVLPEEYAV